MMPSDVPAVHLRAADGARATIALDGAHVTSWIPSGQTEDRLFVSARSTFGTGNAIRGGIPVIFPQFGAFGALRQHGFARLRRWSVVGAPDNTSSAQLHLADSEETRALWPHAFRCELTVEVAGASLEVAMTVRNVDTLPFDFTAAFHPYFAVRRAFAARVEGLGGCRYRDSLREGHVFTETSPHLDIVGPLDRIYYDAPDRLSMVDGERTVTIEKSGFPEAVVWNPGVEGTRSRLDFAEGEEQSMLCVEAARIAQPCTLAPGESWTGVQRMTAA